MHTVAQNSKKALILMNLGSPKSTNVEDVRAYLGEFLMDKYVIDFPFLFRYFLVNGIIKMFRAPKSAEAYRKVWLPEGSPLIVLTNQLRDAVQSKVSIPVFSMMRYGAPTPQEVLSKIQIQYPNIEEVIVLPLYPHWTMSSYETAVDYTKSIYEENSFLFNLRFIDPFYNNSDYIKALSKSIQPYLTQQFDLLMFSYHGIPERHIRKDIARRDSKNKMLEFKYPSQNYQEQCIETSRLVAETLGLSTSQYITTFQSRLSAAGKKWLQPATASTLEILPAQGKKNILIVCPAFINDCLETLEEISMEGKASFMENGGTSFQYIPCLNAQEDFVNCIINWI